MPKDARNIEKLPSGRIETPAASIEQAKEAMQSRQDLLSTAVRATEDGDLRELDGMTPAAAKELVGRDPLHAALLVLRGTERIDGLLTPQPPASKLKRFISIFVSNTGDVDGAARLAGPVFLLRTALHEYFEKERGVAGMIPGAQDRNMIRRRRIDHATDDAGGPSRATVLAPSALRELQYTTLGLASVPEHGLRKQLEDTILPIAKNDGRKYIPFEMTDIRLQDAADAYAVVMRSEQQWQKGVKQNSAVTAALDPEVARALKTDNPGNMWVTARVIDDRHDPIVAPIRKLVEPEAK